MDQILLLLRKQVVRQNYGRSAKHQLYSIAHEFVQIISSTFRFTCYSNAHSLLMFPTRIAVLRMMGISLRTLKHGLIK